MVQSYRLLGLDELANDSLEVLRKNYPDHPNLNKDGTFKAAYTAEGAKPTWLSRISFGLFGRQDPQQINTRKSTTCNQAWPGRAPALRSARIQIRPSEALYIPEYVASGRLQGATPGFRRGPVSSPGSCTRIRDCPRSSRNGTYLIRFGCLPRQDRRRQGCRRRAPREGFTACPDGVDARSGALKILCISP